MVFGYIKDLKKVLNEIIDDKLESMKGLDFYVVTGVNDDLTCNIKKLNVNQQYDNVKIVGTGLGNLKGQIKLPDVNDIVIVSFIQNSEQPVILGSVFDTLTNTPDTKLTISSSEYFVNNKANGSFLLIDDENTITLRTPNGAKLRLKDDGEFKLFDGNDYGVQSDGSGNITIYGDLTIQGGVSDLKYDDDNGSSITTKSVYSGNSKTNGTWN